VTSSGASQLCNVMMPVSGTRPISGFAEYTPRGRDVSPMAGKGRKAAACCELSRNLHKSRHSIFRIRSLVNPRRRAIWANVRGSPLEAVTQCQHSAFAPVEAFQSAPQDGSLLRRFYRRLALIMMADVAVLGPVRPVAAIVSHISTLRTTHLSDARLLPLTQAEASGNSVKARQSAQLTARTDAVVWCGATTNPNACYRGSALSVDRDPLVAG
jgi:hypothetical protein